MDPSQTDALPHELNLDQAIELFEGESYLLTTEVSGGGTTSDTFVLNWNQSPNSDFDPATWGGVTSAFPIRSGGSNDWSTVEIIPGFEHFDLSFSFTGKVVPEPATLGMLAIGALAMSGRRRRRI